MSPAATICSAGGQVLVNVNGIVRRVLLMSAKVGAATEGPRGVGAEGGVSQAASPARMKAKGARRFMNCLPYGRRARGELRCDHVWRATGVNRQGRAC